MAENTEITQIRARGEITIPKKVREWLGVDSFDFISFDRTENNKICVHRIIPRRMNKNHGGEDGDD